MISKKNACIAILLALLLGTSSLPALHAKENEPAYGLILKDGQITLNGKPYYAMGVNYYDAFLVYLRGDRQEQGNIENEFKTLSESGIPAVRISMCGYSSNEYGVFLDYKKFYFSGLDRVIEYAEQYHIGIIFDLCWAIDAIPNYYDLPRSAIGDPDGPVIPAACDYVRAIVSRYKNSPAVWAWEIGNEYNLDCDLDGVLTRPAEQTVTSDDVETFYRALAEVIREEDPYRLITGGDSEPRNAAYHLYHDDSWQLDSQAEQAEMMRKLSPAPMNTMSVHVYQNTGNSEEDAGTLRENMIDDFDTRVDWYMKAAREAGQALMVGEFGIMERTCASVEVAKKVLAAQCAAFEKHDVQLSFIWVYGKDDGDIMNISPTNSLSYQYDAVVEGNIRLREAGKQESDSYWNSVTPMLYGVPEQDRSPVDTIAGEETDSPANTDSALPSDNESNESSETDAPASGNDRQHRIASVAAITAACAAIIAAGAAIIRLGKRRKS